LNPELSRHVMAIASDIFNVPLAALSLTSSPETVERWDSVQHLSFVLALEEAFHIEVSPENIEQIRNLGDAVTLVQAKTGAGR